MRDQRVLLVRIEVERLVHVAVEVRDSIRSLDDEALGRLPTHLLELRHVGFLKVHDEFAFAVAQDGDRRHVDAIAVVDHELA